MKIVNILLGISLLIIACRDDRTVTISKAEYDRLHGDTIKPEYPKYFTVGETTYTIEPGSDGYEYYKFNTYARGSHYFHYPGCKRCLILFGDRRIMDTLKIK